MFSQTAEYALRAAVFLAAQPEGQHSSQTIAAATQVPAGYLSKILNDLVKAGLVSSRRGPNGGFSLVRPAGEISVLDVINAVDPFRRIRSCPLGLKEHATQLCKLHLKMDSAMEMIERTLAGSSLADMLSPAVPGKPVFPTLQRRPLPQVPAKRGRRGRIG